MDPYKARHLVENALTDIKQFRGIPQAGRHLRRHTLAGLLERQQLAHPKRPPTPNQDGNSPATRAETHTRHPDTGLARRTRPHDRRANTQRTATTLRVDGFRPYCRTRPVRWQAMIRRKIRLSDAMIGDNLLDMSTGIEITVENVEMHLVLDVPWTTVQGRLENGELLTFQGLPRRLTPWWQKRGFAVLPHPRPH